MVLLSSSSFLSSHKKWEPSCFRAPTKDHMLLYRIISFYVCPPMFSYSDHICSSLPGAWSMPRSSMTSRYNPANLAHTNRGCFGSLFVFINCVLCVLICFLNLLVLFLCIKKGKSGFHVSKHEGQALPSVEHNTTVLYICQYFFLIFFCVQNPHRFLFM